MTDRRYERLLLRTGSGTYKLGKAVQIMNGKESDAHLELAFPST
jgi:hypothetical protein